MAHTEKSVNEKHSVDSERTAAAVEDARPRKGSFVDVDEDKLSAAFENPLSGIPKEQLLEENPRETEGILELTPEDREVLKREQTHRWHQPKTLYWLVVICSLAAAGQGMDETVNNGAQALYLKQLNIPTDRFPPGMVDNLTGLVVGARYCNSSSSLPYRETAEQPGPLGSRCSAQQWYGLSVMAYYSTTIFIESGYSTTSALLASMGTGILNWVFALPAVFTIDRWGRRNLFLFTFPFLAILLLWTGFSFWFDNTKARVGMVTTGMYLFEVFYSPGEGPVPFTYSAEAFPVHVRDVGMSFAIATTWCFNFILSFTWPHLLTAFKPQGAFAWYGSWCIILWCLILLFVPETQALTLEELDQVFSVSTRKHRSYQMKNAVWHFRVLGVETEIRATAAVLSSSREVERGVIDEIVVILSVYCATLSETTRRP
ncbi:hypothetical protein A1O7_01035 [Cladophialophora yegresii CBS 114405]|uniref:Major facilitator superfamily (MFS) profile domain-containing protein n=1 Tax=Cladophialophora yegresii CBS 114405 TaxID=1182544 RepID=W9W9A5_9EURO|nr:uncharacterized protein A1O7_01035 [Cladophialophora yegresii CBS 114405]EXJ64697.1 hypothetical protein A1O7_01035 [Cladophialophora yegresii CBS 114405]